MFGPFDNDLFDINGDGKVDFLEKALAYEIFMEDDDEEDSDGFDDFDEDDEDY